MAPTFPVVQTSGMGYEAFRGRPSCKAVLWSRASFMQQVGTANCCPPSSPEATDLLPPESGGAAIALGIQPYQVFRARRAQARLASYRLARKTGSILRRETFPGSRDPSQLAAPPFFFKLKPLTVPCLTKYTCFCMALRKGNGEQPSWASHMYTGSNSTLHERGQGFLRPWTSHAVRTVDLLSPVPRPKMRFRCQIMVPVGFRRMQ